MRWVRVILESSLVRWIVAIHTMVMALWIFLFYATFNSEAAPFLFVLAYIDYPVLWVFDRVDIWNHGAYYWFPWVFALLGTLQWLTIGSMFAITSELLSDSPQ